MTPIDPPDGPVGFERDVFIDKPGIVGARWWHKSLIAEDAAVRRRHVLKTLGVLAAVGGVVGLVGVGIAHAVDDSEPVHLEPKPSVEMQKAYGWDVGARGEGLVFDGKSTAPFLAKTLADLPGVMQSTTFAPFAVTTALESLDATPTQTLSAGDSKAFQKLSAVIVPAETEAMRLAYRVGDAFAQLCADRPADLAVLVDLPGPESVAFAAGAAKAFEPVLLFDNWPHPRGVVPSHMVLAALAYYQPRFASTKADRAQKKARPMFLLDRGRLNAYSEEGTRFDNRYYARVPTGAALALKGFPKLLYVVQTPSGLPEPQDILLGDAQGSLTARAIALSDFGTPVIAPTDRLQYGGSTDTDASIWVNYPFVDGYVLPSGSRVADSKTKDYRFKPHPGTTSLAKIGVTAMAVTASGVLIAAALDRNGSMNRFSGGWSG